MSLKRYSPSDARGRWCYGALAACLMLLPTSLEAAEHYVLQLASGGRLEGELLNPTEAPRTKYQLRLADGSELTFDREQVREATKLRPEELEYQKILHQFPDTAEGHWKLSEWCREHNLYDIRKKHLERIIELDTDHADARRLLGYSKVDGAWKTQAQIMTERGYVEYKGKWRLRQEVEIAEEARKQELAEKAWATTLKRWREWLDVPDRQNEARRKFGDVSDPAAIPALKRMFEQERLEAVRNMYVDALARMNHPLAWQMLAEYSLLDPSPEVRANCLDLLDDQPRPSIVSFFISRLNGKYDNTIVNRAALGLKRMKDTTSMGPLIEALNTTHTYQVSAGAAGQYSASFGPNGGGFAMNNNQPKSQTVMLNNEAVLDALLTMSNGVNFNYDKGAWKRWFETQRRTSKLDARRGT
ncbi:MAG: HEAT repeat domain-containing protein [Planctomycetes bacterium]|nr:HEAT repeat domain-containing protein [Planctomycetota bacterium]